MRKDADMAMYHRCPYCGRQYRTKFYADLHLKEHMPLSTPALPTSTPPVSASVQFVELVRRAAAQPEARREG